jgi:hypothetical protein
LQRILNPDDGTTAASRALSAGSSSLRNLCFSALGATGRTPRPNTYSLTTTRLTFSASEGTEFELRYQATDGQPQECYSPLSRGHVFVTADGTSATFYSFASLEAEYQN